MKTEMQIRAEIEYLYKRYCKIYWGACHNGDKEIMEACERKITILETILWVLE